MPNVDELVETAVSAVVTRVSGRTVALIALACYPGLGLALPLAFGWPVPNLVSMNLLAVSMAAVISLGWLGVQLQAKDRRHLVEWTSNLRLLNGEEFEWLVGEVFRREGWTVRETGHQDRADGNIDLELTKGPERHLVQCKRWSSWQVGVNDIRAFGGTLLRENLPGSRGVFVTLSDFTEQARDEAEQTGMTLVGRPELYRHVEQARRSEPCPVCKSPMVLDRSLRGWWLRCVASGCAGKRDLGREPGRAVDLLTQVPALIPNQPAAD